MWGLITRHPGIHGAACPTAPAHRASGSTSHDDSRHPAWFLNMAKNPDDIWLEVGTERFKVRGESLEGQERAEALARIAKIAPRYRGYQEKTDREIPIVRLTRDS
jgi:deazaflavin-dependent oxidoreductase (nitroreductase family)